MASAELVITGSASFLAVVDVLELAYEMLDLIPEWHVEQREEMEKRIETLWGTAREKIRVTGDC
jgi:hypothetical protein